jgi:hypothetical protein
VSHHPAAGIIVPDVMQVLLFSIVLFFVATFPATWLLMLFLGNVGLQLSYWGTLPLGTLVSFFVSGATSRAFRA